MPAAPLPELATRIGPLLERYLLSREREVLALLDQRTKQHRTVSGLHCAWLAARHERPVMLVVEEGCSSRPV